MSLKEYRKKRDFKRTREPVGPPSGRKKSTGNMFIVQKHDASRLHYDFRLEMEGVLKSWAVPKGFPMQKGERHLAVEVEDHPIDYAHFEGTIAPGNYGAGTVMVWDEGTYQVQGEDPLDGLKKGKLHLTLTGKKLKGDWALVRMHPRENKDKPQWLLFKSGEDAKPISARAEDQSVLTRKSLKQIAEGGGPQWQSNRKTTTAPQKIKTAPPAVEDEALAKLPRAKPKFVEPMKCLLVEELPKGPEWVYEIKFDGVRALAVKTGDKISLISRSAKDLTSKYHEVVEALGNLSCDDALLDGEIVAVDKQGVPHFQLLQSYLTAAEKPPLLYYVFDLLNLNGRDLTGLPLGRRKEMLKKLLESVPDTVLFSSSIEADSERVLKAMKSRGLEGLVAKKRDSKYESGRRSGAWVKYKWTHEQEFIIGGYTPPRGGRNHFGALLIGYYDKGKLLFASKVGTGFDEAMLKSLYQQFQKIVRHDCPFVNLPEQRAAAARGGLGVAEFKRCTWLQPKLVCQVRFSEWTEGAHLRQPVFLGLRDDKKPKDVVREKPRHL